MVENDRALLGVLDDLLSNEGCQVYLAEDGESGLEQARQARPKVIVADIRMPHMGGFELLERLGADNALKDIPVIIMSGQAEVEVKHLGRRLGAAAFFTKPFRPEDLIEAVKTCF